MNYKTNLIIIIISISNLIMSAGEFVEFKNSVNTLTNK